MTHKISPVAFRLGISSNWLSLSHAALKSANAPLLNSDRFIRAVVQGVLLQNMLFTSPVIIHRTMAGLGRPGAISISLFVWDASANTGVRAKQYALPAPVSFLFTFLTIQERAIVTRLLASGAQKDPRALKETPATLGEQLLASKLGVSRALSSSRSNPHSVEIRGNIKLRLASVLLREILRKLLGSLTPVRLHITEIPSPVFNAKILCDYMALKIALNPYYHRPVVLEALRAASRGG